MKSCEQLYNNDNDNDDDDDDDDNDDVPPSFPYCHFLPFCHFLTKKLSFPYKKIVISFH